MHKALYRKWRPQTFTDVCGQEHITSVLSWQVESGRPSHAYLFCGSRGTGKTTCAKILAKAVNCEAPEHGSPCGRCEACLGIDSGAITDVIEMDAASNNGVEDVRSIREDVVYSPSSVKYRVYIIDEVHMLSVSAFNALLKTLEEPPSHVIFILATTELQKLPATIVSRCQRFDFRRITIPVIADRLSHIAESEGIGLEPDAAALIAKLSQGGLRDAISMLELCAGQTSATGGAVTADAVEKTAGVAGRGILHRTVAAIAAGDTEALFDIVRTLHESSLDIGTYWQDLTAFYRDLLIIKASKNARTYLDMTEAEYEDTARTAALLRRKQISYHIRVMEKAMSDMQRSGMPKRLCAELALVRMTDTALSGRDTELEAMQDRIAALEDALAAVRSGATPVTSAISATPAPPTAQPARAEHAADAKTAPVLSAPQSAEPKQAQETDNTTADPLSPAHVADAVRAAPPAPTAEANTDAPAERQSGAQTGARLLRAVSYYSEMIADYDRIDRSKTELLRLTKGYRTQDGLLVIKTGESFIHMMLDNPEVRAQLLSCALRHDKTITAVSVERQDDPAAEHDLIDELAEDGEE